MPPKNRDEFTAKTKLQIAKRAGWLCSDPFCRRATVGSNSDGNGEINLGTAAHICAAAPGGPRYDPNMTPEQRISPDNGIWMCRLHGTAVDVKDSQFTVELLHEWKAKAQKDSLQRVLYNELPHERAVNLISQGDLNTRIRAATVADLEIFRRSDKWPSTAIGLTLEVEGLSDPVNTSKLSTILTTLDDLILVAQPGMGKTTTLFQIAEAILENGNGSPIIVPLGDWSAEEASLFESILKRQAFRGISEDDLRTVAAIPGVVLLLDGWNELDTAARRRATVQIERLQLELPELNLLISTRKQSLDVPISGTRINLLPLDETQQLNIASVLRGDAGERIIDQAWRTAGIRELVTIPLYLTSLLSLPEGTPFPTTKEEVLRRFVAVHEENNQHSEVLGQVTYDLHQRFLEDLAATATRAVSTTITEAIARKSVSETDDRLVTEGQITEKPQPNVVLEALVSHHVLMRAGTPAGYSFQHQQFQEWYASHFVERLILASIDDNASLITLKSDVLNQPVWEEAILFACDRLSRGSLQQQNACAVTISAAFLIDPILAAEMIYRSTDAVWTRAEITIQNLVKQWHQPGKIDRALRFMISSGRPEFFDQVWPLLTHEDDQIHLQALRAGTRFRTSLLAGDAVARLKALPVTIRKNVLHQIASNSDMDGLEFAANIAITDPDDEVKAAVVEAFAFRRADRHIAYVLNEASDKTFDLLVNNGLIDEIADETVKVGLAAANERLAKRALSIYDQIYLIVYGHNDVDRSTELVKLITEMEIDNNQDNHANLIYEAKKQFPKAVAEGILNRVRKSRSLPYHSLELMAGSGFIFDDDLCEIALEDSAFNTRANAAASVLGQKSVGHMIDVMLEIAKVARNNNGNYDKKAGDRYHTIKGRLKYVQTASLLAAIEARTVQANNIEIAELADLISAYSDDGSERRQPFDEGTLAVICGLVLDWGDRLLNSEDATRAQLASIARLASHSPSVNLLPLLKQMLDEDIRRRRAFKVQALAEHYRQGTATNEARTCWAQQYQQAFDAIKCLDTAILMHSYLVDQDFGHHAAMVLAAQWRALHEPNNHKRWSYGPDFSLVKEKRAARLSDPTASSSEADAIFSIVESLLKDSETDAIKRHALTLAAVAVTLPHSNRDDMIVTLLSIGDRNSRNKLLNGLVLSGVIIDVNLVKTGIADVFVAAQKEPWILTEREELKDWLRLLPFTNKPNDAFDIIMALPDEYRTPHKLKKMLGAFGVAPGISAENVLFLLAEAEPRLYSLDAWRAAVISRHTLSAATKFIDLVARGIFNGIDGMENFHMSTRIANLIGEFPELRTYVYELLKNPVSSPGFVLLTKAVTENPDANGLLLLIQSEIDSGRNFTSWRIVENVITEHVPSESWQGAYDVLAVPAAELRRKLLEMTTDGGSTDAAARCLNLIDKIRDQFGAPESEPRHPDLASGKAWPILTPKETGSGYRN